MAKAPKPHSPHSPFPPHKAGKPPPAQGSTLPPNVETPLPSTHAKLFIPLEGEELILGPRALLEALKGRSGQAKRIIISQGRGGKDLLEIKARAEKAGLRPIIISREGFHSLKDLKHQGVAGIFTAHKALGLVSFVESIGPNNPSLIVALDHSENPGNLGALLRSAQAFGADCLLTGRDRQVGLSPGAIKSAQGALEHVPLIRAPNLNSALKTLKNHGYWIVGAHKQGEHSVNTFDFPKRTVLVLGAESRKLSTLTQEICDFLVKIPMEDNADSLNLSVAGAIFMYAWRALFEKKE
jgi:23S rRNA (guanosine2251-2'-O)-methyltransferase